ncbi:hypothetical protein [Carbonactinospora thermoautotrophica]|uniref:hypothetical protein n=1 Tax=Carbonactinospora thermoautotrophica TaxID=1469144 RepID=UPI000831219D|nr:hypothetical protein [Carbonactinospora thermoautotrophica]
MASDDSVKDSVKDSVERGARYSRRVVLLSADPAAEDGRPGELGRALARVGWDVLLLRPLTEGGPRSYTRVDDVRVMRVPAPAPYVEQARRLSKALAGMRGRRFTPAWWRRQARRAQLRGYTALRDTAAAWNRGRARLHGRVGGPWARPGQLAAAYPPLVEAFAPDAIHACDDLVLPAALAAKQAVGGACRLLADAPGVGAARRSKLYARVDRLIREQPADLAARYPELVGVTPPREPGSARTAIAGDTAAPYLTIGPTNMAGQGYAWARAVAQHLPGVRSEALMLRREKGGLLFECDELIPLGGWDDPRWQLRRMATVLDGRTHVLAENLKGVFGSLNGSFLTGDVPELIRAGIRFGVVFHGSEIRNPARHAALEPFSPFTDPECERTKQLQQLVERTEKALERFEGPRFVSTPDLIDDVPDARWLPVVVDLDAWTPGPPPLERERPVVIHAPTNPFLKGTDLIEPVVRRLHDKGVIEYRRLEKVPPAELVAFVQDADIVLDHFVIGNYSVLTCQAMAAGRVTVCHVHERVRKRVPAEIPVVEADPTTIGEVLEWILAERDQARALAAAGPGFVREFHDGRMSAAVLAGFLGVADAPGLPSPAGFLTGDGRGG